MEDLTVVHLRGLQVLLAGADSVEHKILDQNLSLWGVVSHSAPSLRAALGKMRAAVEQRHPFDVVLADWDMAADGNQLGHEFRKACESTGAALVLLNQALSSESPEAPGASVPSLTKPVMASELFNCLIGLAQTRKPPSIRVAPLGQMAAPAAVNKKTSGRALVVEDNLVNQRVASKLLQKLGWSADVAAGGREALEWLERNQYDLVLMDCQMPEMDGFQTTAEIRRRESPGQRIPIIALTANAMEGDREKCLKAGMDDYLSKPVRPQTLAETVARWSSKVQVGQPASSEPGPT
jgi:CheY-like chemotaxis protein